MRSHVSLRRGAFRTPGRRTPGVAGPGNRIGLTSNDSGGAADTACPGKCRAGPPPRICCRRIRRARPRSPTGPASATAAHRAGRTRPSSAARRYERMSVFLRCSDHDRPLRWPSCARCRRSLLFRLQRLRPRVLATAESLHLARKSRRLQRPAPRRLRDTRERMGSAMAPLRVVSIRTGLHRDSATTGTSRSHLPPVEPSGHPRQDPQRAAPGRANAIRRDRRYHPRSRPRRQRGGRRHPAGVAVMTMPRRRLRGHTRFSTVADGRPTSPPSGMTGVRGYLVVVAVVARLACLNGSPALPKGTPADHEHIARLPDHQVRSGRS